MPTRDGESGQSEPVRSPPAVCGVVEDRLSNSENPPSAPADRIAPENISEAIFSEATYVGPGTAIQMATYGGELTLLTNRRRRLDGDEQGEFEERPRARRRCDARAAHPCCSCTRHSTCTRPSGGRQGGCECRRAGRPCTHTCCSVGCRNRGGGIRSESSSLAPFLAQRHQADEASATTSAARRPASAAATAASGQVSQAVSPTLGSPTADLLEDDGVSTPETEAAEDADSRAPREGVTSVTVAPGGRGIATPMGQQR